MLFFEQISWQLDQRTEKNISSFRDTKTWERERDRKKTNKVKRLDYYSTLSLSLSLLSCLFIHLKVRCKKKKKNHLLRLKEEPNKTVESKLCLGKRKSKKQCQKYSHQVWTFSHVICTNGLLKVRLPNCWRCIIEHEISSPTFIYIFQVIFSS